jgi:hypothetical protein
MFGHFIPPYAMYIIIQKTLIPEKKTKYDGMISLFFVPKRTVYLCTILARVSPFISLGNRLHIN